MSRCIACNSILYAKDLAADRREELCRRCLTEGGVIFHSSDYAIPSEPVEDEDE